MTWRVLLSQSGMRITRPGYDVLATDAWDQCLLDLGIKSGQILAWGIVDLATGSASGTKVATFYYGPFSQKPEVRVFGMTNGVLRYPYYNRYGIGNAQFAADYNTLLDVQPSGVNITLVRNSGDGSRPNPNQAMVMVYRKQYLGQGMFAVAFNYDTGGGIIDPMRVTNNVRWGGAGDPLDPNLVFSALHPPGIAEQVDFYNGGNPNGWQPAFTTARTYTSPPLVLPCWLNDNGQRFYPGHVTAPASSRWLLYSEARNNGNNTYLCTTFVETTFNNANIMSGRLRVFVIGPGG